MRCDACKEHIMGKYIRFSDGSIFCDDCYQYSTKCLNCKKPIGEDGSIDGLCQICYNRAPKCDICEKAVIGSYTRFTDQTISCDNCMSKYLKCDRCGKPVVKYTKIRGKILCKYCLAYAPRCGVCNNPIIGTYWIFDKEYVCDYCYKLYERCNICGMPSQILFTVYDKKICYSCEEKVQRCSTCGLPIIGRYYSYKNQNGIFCEHCEKNSYHCDSCGRPLGQQYIEISDNQKICLDCKKTAISTDKQLMEIVKLAQEGIAEIGMTIQHSLYFRLISKKLLDSRIKEYGTELTAERNLGLFQRKDEKMNIFIQTHLPYQITLGTVCHELSHAWQSENVLEKHQSLIYREGFCEWVTYKILMKYGHKSQAELILSRVDAYGIGFQKFYEYEKNHGVEALLIWAKNVK